MMRGHIFLVVIVLITPIVLSKHIHFYRKDYTYIEEYDAFYKVHWDINGLDWNSAFRICDEEGAKLFYPKGNEWTVVKNLTDAMPIAPNTSEIYVGIHDEFNLGEFITIDGKSTESPLNAEGEVEETERCMMMDYTTGQFKITGCSRTFKDPIKPFVCKKVDDESCPTIDHEYIYVKNKNKCYKVHRRQKTWHAAMQTCFMEGGILAIFDKITDLPTWANEGENYFVGVRKMFASSDFYTVKGDKFENASFKSWYVARDQQNRDCGVITYYNNQELRMAVIECFELLPFICEMTAK